VPSHPSGRPVCGALTGPSETEGNLWPSTARVHRRPSSTRGSAQDETQAFAITRTLCRGSSWAVCQRQGALGWPSPARNQDGTIIETVFCCPEFDRNSAGDESSTMPPVGSAAILMEDTSLPRSRCPFLRPAAAEWLWPVEGICRGRMDGRLMVPPVSHYLNLCVTDDHHLCEVFRARAFVVHAVSQEQSDLVTHRSPQRDLASPASPTPGNS
jgi:hypothetical protein